MKMVRGRIRLEASVRNESGQSLLETAVSIPLLLSVAFNIINWAYYWFMVLALSSAPRHAVQYASQGGAAIATSSGIPAVADVCSLVADNFGNNVLHNSSLSCGGGNVQIRVCISSLGVNSSSGVVSCQSYGPSLVSLSSPPADPEEPLFALQRVDIAYQVTPIIPGTVFNIAVPTNLKFHRQVSMRSLY
jgi:hypothetical protein